MAAIDPAPGRPPIPGTLLQFVPMVSDFDGAYQFFRDWGILGNQPPRCQICQHPMTLVRDPSFKNDGHVFRCTVHKGSEEIGPPRFVSSELQSASSGGRLKQGPRLSMYPAKLVDSYIIRSHPISTFNRQLESRCQNLHL